MPGEIVFSGGRVYLPPSGQGTKSCGACAFFSPLQGKETEGLCRFLPPQMFMTYVRDDDNDGIYEHEYVQKEEENFETGETKHTVRMKVKPSRPVFTSNWPHVRHDLYCAHWRFPEQCGPVASEEPPATTVS